MQSAKNWDELRNKIKKCPYGDCKRNKDKMPIFFRREESTLSEIKYIIISQEPGVSVKDKQSSDENEEKLIEYCIGTKSPQYNSPIKRTLEILNRKKFDPTKEDIYWTHALKCPPIRDDKEIKDNWIGCAQYCVNHFKEELSLIPSEKLIIIPMGGFATTLCNYIFDNKSLNTKVKIINYIADLKEVKKFRYQKKEIIVAPFIHPSNRNRITKFAKTAIEALKKEDEFIEYIRSFS